MRDPDPSNIAGRKIRSHSFEHQIRWDYLVIAAVAGFVAWKLFGGVSLSSSSDHEGEEIEIRESSKTPALAHGGD